MIVSEVKVLRAAISTLFCYDKQDKYINPGQHPELIGRGTFSAAEIE